jgi:hypothetical protein
LLKQLTFYRLPAEENKFPLSVRRKKTELCRLCFPYIYIY